MEYKTPCLILFHKIFICDIKKIWPKLFFFCSSSVLLKRSGSCHFLNPYSRVPNCKGGLFSVFSIFCLQYHFIMTPPFYDFLSQVVQFDSISYINLSKIHHLHFIMTPAFSEIFNLCRPPLTNRPPPTIRYTRVPQESSRSCY